LTTFGRHRVQRIYRIRTSQIEVLRWTRHAWHGVHDGCVCAWSRAPTWQPSASSVPSRAYVARLCQQARGRRQLQAHARARTECGHLAASELGVAITTCFDIAYTLMLRQSASYERQVGSRCWKAWPTRCAGAVRARCGRTRVCAVCADDAMNTALLTWFGARREHSRDNFCTPASRCSGDEAFVRERDSP